MSEQVPRPEEPSGSAADAESTVTSGVALAAATNSRPSSRTSHNGSPPACGKRTRTPLESSEGRVASEDGWNASDGNHTCSMVGSSSGVDGPEGDEEDEEPHAKMPRNSPTPEEEEEEDDDEELQKINHLEKEDREEAATSKKSMDTPQPKSEKAAPQYTQPREKNLPLASNLKQFMEPGATKLFRPKPEWYKGDQNGNPSVRRKSRTANEDSPSTGSSRTLAALPEGSILERLANRFRCDSHGDGGNNNDFEGGRSAAAYYEMMANIHQQIQARHNNRKPTHDNDQEEAEANDNPHPATFGRDFDPALNVCIRENCTEAALALLDYGAPVEAENAKGVTPLIVASQRGNLVMVRDLLHRGALASRASSNGITAVMQAAHFGHLKCLELLLQVGGISLMEMANFNQTTALMRAAQEGHIDIIKALLDRGAAVNRRNRVQMTALMLASQRGHAHVCRELIYRGAELDSMTAQRSTSLMLACKRGHMEVVRILVTSGCDLWVTDSRGRTAREVAQRRESKDLEDLLDGNVQLDLMQQQQRQHRNYTMILLWNLLQKERAMVPLSTSLDPPPFRRVTIHQIVQELNDPSPRKELSLSSPYSMPTTLPYHVSKKSTQALLRTMALPESLVECITKFLPMPLLWERRVGMLTKQSVINADAAVRGALDIIDEILEEAGFVAALDFGNITPPTHFKSWSEWRVYCRLKCRRGGPVQLPDDGPDRPETTTATPPTPQDPPTALEMTRQVGFLQILSQRRSVLAHVLKQEPYKMPETLVQQLITTSDVQSLVRRMGSRGVHFESTVAMDLIMLINRLSSWYARQREDKPYPSHSGVAQPPQPSQRHRTLPIRVPTVKVTVPFQYDPYQPTGAGQAIDRHRPSAPAPSEDQI
ncbi:ankyrin repeat, family A (RFXANK-like), 2 [Seminavis robusta]|uniref:Ankyrin repeat, family A (RFXANK-like), 2 n=1 Tax=Seminavis robusta TaxID=568900 RepID=A0A9N8E2D9_9STRA|nr:ankyrin repeat, family A (RFXANK-like), 2 [Seminavis robusta]|eukprot:Sro584_g170770.1 ankyrin repeat, family A (RFXANK-like), 2 (883) ;mRNA; f:13748-16578